MIILGVTGSIGMGKSTVASLLADEAIPVHCADQTMHDLMAPGAKGYQAISAAFSYETYPQIYGKKDQAGHRTLNRKALGDLVFQAQEQRVKLEKLLHPLVRESQKDFIKAQQKLGARIVALDVPLLYETGGEQFVDAVIVASAPYPVQQARVLARGITQERFEAILATQMSDHEKRARADYIVPTGLGLAHSRKIVKEILESF